MLELFPRKPSGSCSTEVHVNVCVSVLTGALCCRIHMQKIRDQGQLVLNVECIPVCMQPPTNVFFYYKYVNCCYDHIFCFLVSKQMQGGTEM